MHSHRLGNKLQKTGHVQTAQSQLPLVFVSPAQLSRRKQGSDYGRKVMPWRCCFFLFFFSKKEQCQKGKLNLQFKKKCQMLRLSLHKCVIYNPKKLLSEPIKKTNTYPVGKKILQYLISALPMQSNLKQK